MAIARVNIIGSGNVAAFLAHHLYTNNVRITAIYSRNLLNAEELAIKTGARPTDNLKDIGAADLNIVCIKDDAISGVIANLDKATPIVHTSGSMGLDLMKGFQHCGVIYPVQTISKARVANLKGVPFLVEANSIVFSDSLKELCNDVFASPTYSADSNIRSEVHLAAVFANNFSNFFLAKAEEVLRRSNLDFQILKPLMVETIGKAFDTGPCKSQTGPAIRGDAGVMENHLSKIEDPQLQEIYRLISAEIKKLINS